jgi:enoyl-CoA hydratase/carnithine racemase
MSTEHRISTEVRGPILLIGLSRAAKMNAFDPPMLRQLGEAYARLEHDPELRVGVLFAHGDNFTAGLDLGKVAPLVAQGENLFPDGGIDPFGLFGTPRTKPVVCVVQGLCLTIGIELLLSCDMTVAADDTRFGQIEIKRGIMPFGGATLRWVQTLGWGNAMRYLLTGDELGAEEALRLGLVQEVAPLGHQLERGLALAHRIAKQAPLAVQATIVSARTALERGYAAALAELMPEARKLMASDDAREGLMSFLERRDGKFTGR